MDRSYRRNFSATLLSILKVLLGLAAAGILVFEIIGLVGLSAVGLTGILQQAVNEAAETAKNNANLAITEEQLNALTQLISSVGQQLAFLGIMILLPAMIGPLLEVLDGIGALMLRISGKGGRIIQAVHFLRMLLWFAVVVDLVGDIIFVIIYGSHFIELSGYTAGSTALIIGVVVVLLLLISLFCFQAFCYQKDLVQVFGTVSRDAVDGDPNLRKNHLSFLSILGMLVSFIPLIISVYFVMNSGTQQTGNSPLIMKLAAAYCVVNTLRYLLVMICNESLKEEFSARGKVIRSSIGRKAGILAVFAACIAGTLYFKVSHVSEMENELSVMVKLSDADISAEDVNDQDVEGLIALAEMMGVTPEFKEKVDSYEVIADEYIAVQKKTNATAEEIAAADEKLASLKAEIAEIDQSTLPTGDLIYAGAVALRIQKKLAEVSPEMAAQMAAANTVAQSVAVSGTQSSGTPAEGSSSAGSPAVGTSGIAAVGTEGASN